GIRFSIVPSTGGAVDDETPALDSAASFLLGTGLRPNRLGSRRTAARYRRQAARLGTAQRAAGHDLYGRRRRARCGGSGPGGLGRAARPNPAPVRDSTHQGRSERGNGSDFFTNLE